MAEHDDRNTFPPRELSGPLARAQEIADEHSLWTRDGRTPGDRQSTGGHERFSWQRAWDLYWQVERYALSPGAALWKDRHRYGQVLAALRLAGGEARHLIVMETGATVETILASLLPSLLDLAKWVGLGAVVGGAIGAFGGPADEVTIPGGALAGAELGLWIANSLGLAGLLLGVAQNLGQFAAYAKEATELAWYAGEDHRASEHADLVAASKLYAFALAELWLALLQALVAEVLKRVGEYTGKKIAANEALPRALNEVTQKIRASKLGTTTADWFRDHFEQIRTRLEERWRAREKKPGEDSSQDQSSTPAESNPGKKSSENAPSPKKPSFVPGQSDGGPGQWGPPSTPRTSAGAAYQEQVTGAPPGTEYKVPLARRASGNVDFDGYDPERNVLLDAKDYNNWPPEGPPKLRQMAINKLLKEAKDQVNAADGTPIEWHVPTEAKASELSDIFDNEGIEGIQVVTTPKQ